MNPELRNKYEVVIGIECHTQLATKSKLFCGCNNDSREAAPNTHVCEICLGLPGTLPVVNSRAVELAIRLGRALGASYPPNYHTKFDRKNYFYPDSPKGYQITQFDEPIVGPGKVEFPLGDRIISIGITRAHLEGDAGKLTHPEGASYSLVDLNRAETPLVEIVSEPDMRSAAEAKGYAQELYNIVRYARVSDANLYYGNMRFDVNVSVRRHGETKLGTRTETKNLNSFRAIERAVEYEIKRQIVLVENGERIIQETRGWNDATQETYSMRSKEDADEYRYFPEPDLPPLVITKKMVEAQEQELGLSPNDIRRELAANSMPSREAEVLVSDPVAAKLWREVVKVNKQYAKFSFNWLIGDAVKIAESLGIPLASSKITPVEVAEVSKLVLAGSLSSSNAKTLLASLWTRGGDPAKLAQELGLIQESDESELAVVVDAVIKENQQAVNDYKSGNSRAFSALVGKAMQKTAGKGNPPMINKLLKQRLD